MTALPLISVVASDTTPHAVTVLFLPGLSGNHRQWDRVVAMIEHDDVQIAFGAPILAHSAFGGRRPSVVELGQAMAAELHARPDRSVVIVTHSVGAFVGLAIAHRLGRVVKGVVVVNGGLTTVARFIDAPLRQLFLHPRECLGFLRLFVLVAAPVPGALKRAIASRRWSSRIVVGNLVSSAALESEAQRQSLIAEAGKTETLLALYDNRHHWPEFEAYAADITVPVAFIVGDRDPMTSIDDTETMAAKLPHATLRVLPGIGHAAPLEATDAVVQEIRRLVDDPPLPGSAA